MMLLLLLHAAVTWALAGLIWNVQIVQYPLFHHIGRENFRVYHFGHCLRIGLVIAPLVLGEALTAAWLIYEGERRGVFLASVVLMVVNWVSTAVLQAPVHTRLMGGYDEALVRRLCRTNWLRTVGWTGRAVLVGWMMVR